MSGYTENLARDWIFIFLLKQAILYSLNSDSDRNTECLFLYISTPSFWVSYLAHFSPLADMTSVFNTACQRTKIFITNFLCSVHAAICLFKAKLFLWKCESNTACLLAFFLHISTSYKPNKAHPSFSLTMDWGEKSGVRVWRKSTVRGQKSCWEGKDYLSSNGNSDWQCFLIIYDNYRYI